MTKIRNTKKGMAKKTLSISLAVAMLATSNVPVWAAEDLFTDGEVAVEAFTAEEAPVVEEVEAPVAESSAYTADVKFTGNENVDWNKHAVGATVSVVDADNKAVNYKWAWKVGTTPETALGETENEGVVTDYITEEADFGKNLYLYLRVVENGNTLWEKTYEAATIGAVNVGASQYKFSWGYEDGSSIFTWNETDKIYETEYTGKALPKTAKIVEKDNPEVDRTADFTINYPDDLKNAGTITLKATTKDGKYIGVVEQTLRINPKVISVANMNSDLKATLNADKKSFVWTGNVVKFDKSDVTLVDTETGDDITKLVTGVVSNGDTSVGKDYKTIVSIDDNELVKNYDVAEDVKSVYSDGYAITARSLTDCVFTINSIEYKANLTADDVKKAIVSVVAKDGTKLNLDAVKDRIVVELPEGGIGAASTTPYTVTIKPTATTACLTDKTTATVRVVDRTLANATYDKACAELKAEEYTGKQITKDIAKLTDKKTGLQLKDGNSELVYGTHYTITFGENVNAKDNGQIILVGMGAYEGSQKVITFDITPATVTAKDLTAAPYILYDNEVKKPAEYAEEFNLVVKGHNTKKDEFTLVEGKDADYTVVYDFVSENKVDHKVKATVTLKADGNFTTKESLTKEVLLVAPVLRDEHIQLIKDTYEYTGAPIIPEFNVVVGGKTLVKDTDYVILNTQDVTEVGDAKVVITGKGKYSDKVNAEATFKVVPADAAKVKVTLAKCDTKDGKHVYNGEAHEPAIVNAVLGQNASVKDQFDVSYGTNINAGKGTVVLTPKKTTKNFTGTKTVEFDIEQAVLTGTLTVYNDKNIKIDPKQNAFNYDGTAHRYAKEIFTPDSSLVTADDYEIVYADNVYGKDWNGTQYGHIFVVGKGNFKGNALKANNNEFKADGIFEDAAGNEITSIAVNEYFVINQADIHKNNITVSNGAYREGYNVKPNVVVTVGGKTLIEGTDYKLTFDEKQDRTKVTASNKLDVTITPINGYKAAGNETLSFKWGIDKFDFANAEIVVTGTDAAPIVKVLNDSFLVDPENYDLAVADGKVTVSAKADSENYTGTQTVDIKHALEKPATPMITDVKVVGNKATVVLSGESDGAVGYDYVIGTRDCIETKDYVKVNKNKLTTETTFTYTQQGTYYAYCHAWTRDENGKKVFSDWSNGYPFAVTAITPDTPVITGYKVKGDTVTVTYTKAANADGYDVVLGSTYGTVADEKRPLQYGELVKKNIKGNTVTATFKNVPAGTYYAGLHAFNRTSEDGKKVFSPWSNIRTIRVK